MKKTFLLLLAVLLLFIPTSVLAQSYYFSVESETVHVFWEDDGTMDLLYEYVFVNQPGAHEIDFVDIGLPNYNFQDYNAAAEINGQGLSYISSSEYAGTGSGIAIGLGSLAIPPGGRGTVLFMITDIEDVLYPDTEGDNYASAVFMPNNFGSEYVTGRTDITVIYHLPPGVQPDQPRYHSAPSGFSSTPITGHDNDGRITYTWRNPEGDISRRYEFGASFPASFVPASAISTPTFWERIGVPAEAVTALICGGSVIAFIVLILVLSARANKKRKMKYLPPKIRIEGHGIKRGLTAVEAAVLLERPVDKVFTMILFSLVQKDAAQVLSRDPLKLEFSDPLPENLRKYEAKFAEAFDNTTSRVRKTKLQDLMIDLINSVSTKMKGFSHKETTRYYEDIIQRAWKQVEEADTPEVKSEKFNDHMGWTMLDKDFEDRTQDVFRTGPVYLPNWWHRYDPVYSPTVRSGPSSSKPSAPSSSGGRVLPQLPGAEFAASVTSGISRFSSDVVGNITDFTNRITQKTNPVPKPTSSSGGGWSSGGGSSCACACACAGCACACAGGGR